ncbi:MAG: type II secretion system protein N [Candidatus Omnitrophota bacterium]
MKDNISPEERLLRLIRGKKKEALDKKVTAVPSARPIYFTGFLSFAYFTKAIKVVFAVSLVYLIFTFLYPLFILRDAQLPKIDPEEVVLDQQIEPVKDRKPVEFYLQDIKERQIFDTPLMQKDTAKEEVSVSRDFIKDLKLLGIISGDDPQAIIQDKKTEQTYYLSRGQLVGEIKVEEIQEGRVVLNYKGKRFELYL